MRGEGTFPYSQGEGFTGECPSALLLLSLTCIMFQSHCRVSDRWAQQVILIITDNGHSIGGHLIW